MGNAASGRSGLTAHVDPPQGANKSYLAGSKLTGTVYATTTGNEKKIDSDRLQVFLIGKEDTCVNTKTTITSDSGDITLKNYAREKQDIVRVSIPLIGVGTSVNPGNHAYPFEVQLPDHLPTSMLHSGAGGTVTSSYTRSKSESAANGVITILKPPLSFLQDHHLLTALQCQTLSSRRLSQLPCVVSFLAAILPLVLLLVILVLVEAKS